MTMLKASLKNKILRVIKHTWRKNYMLIKRSNNSYTYNIIYSYCL